MVLFAATDCSGFPGVPNHSGLVCKSRGPVNISLAETSSAAGDPPHSPGVLYSLRPSQPGFSLQAHLHLHSSITETIRTGDHRDESA